MLRGLPFCVLLFSLQSTSSFSQTGADPVYYLKEQVEPPRLIHKVDPEFSALAEQAHVQGCVLLAFTIDRQGMPKDELILSSSGYGLDQQALQALAQWRFQPAQKDGQPVSFRATVDLTFMQTVSSDVSFYHRKAVEQALSALITRQRDPQWSDDSIHLVQSLAESGNSGANFVLGRWMLQGTALPKNEAKGWENIDAAIRKKDPSALRFAGDALIEGKIVPRDVDKGVSYLEKAADGGSLDAQLDLGSRYMDGNGPAANARKARKFLSTCAKAGEAECQRRLQKLNF